MTEQTICPASATLKMLLHGVLPPAEEGAISAHLESCSRCQGALQDLAASGGSWAGLARRLGDTPPPAEPALLRALNRFTASINSHETLPEALGDNELGIDFLDPPGEPGHLGRLDAYEVIEVVGRGGMGVVLKAFDPALNRVVAINIGKTLMQSSALMGW